MILITRYVIFIKGMMLHVYYDRTNHDNRSSLCFFLLWNNVKKKVDFTDWLITFDEWKLQFNRKQVCVKNTSQLSGMDGSESPNTCLDWPESQVEGWSMIGWHTLTLLTPWRMIGYSWLIRHVIHGPIAQKNALQLLNIGLIAMYVIFQWVSIHYKF